MKVNLPGYAPERRGGRTLHRVRVEGDKARRITIPVGPDDPAFWEHYYAARVGAAPETKAAKVIAPGERTLSALVDGYLAHLERQMGAGNISPATLRQRRSLLTRACAFMDEDGDLRMGAYHCDMPPAGIVCIRDGWGAKTAQADTCLKALRAAYAWGIERGWLAHNPAVGVSNVHRSKGGAVAWSPDDLRTFLRAYGPGTAPRMWLMLALWTGARIGDLRILGREHERVIGGAPWLFWQPGKKGSAPVAIPMAPQLAETIRGMPVAGKTYLLTSYGRPFGEGSLGNSVRDWTAAAGLKGRTSHGLRKALGGLLAEAGATQHQIMAVLAHTSPKTSEIYTRSAQRAHLAGEAMAAIGGLRIG